jgi:hypothetical protein
MQPQNASHDNSNIRAETDEDTTVGVAGRARNRQHSGSKVRPCIELPWRGEHGNHGRPCRNRSQWYRKSPKKSL